MSLTQVRLAQTPQGAVVPDDFELVSLAMPEAGPGEVLCRTLFLSLDPYMRSQIAGKHITASINPGDPMRGETISEVLESGSEAFRPGQLVRCFGGWQSHSVHAAADLNAVNELIQPPSYALSLLGMTGLTAWAGMIWQAEVSAGDHVLIPAVTGGVGAAAAQFCHLQGATVVGTAGSDEKCRYAMQELGVSACLNRREANLAAGLDGCFPGGINVYFDLVGGKLLNLASERLAPHARVILAGLISEYDKAARAPGPPPGMWIKARATVKGLVVYDFESRREEFIRACLPHLERGELFQREDISDGLDSAPEAFCRLMRGENFGKVIVRV